MIKILKIGSETYIEDEKGMRLRVNVYGRQKAWKMFGKEIENLNEEELGKLLK